MKTHLVSKLTAALFVFAAAGLGGCAAESDAAVAELERADGHGPTPSPSDPATLVAEGEPAPGAPIPPAAPPKEITPLTLFTVSGTFVPPREGFQADVAKRVDPRAFVWEPIAYPAMLVPMRPSIDLGVAALVERINAHPGKFALVGFSQGGIVISRVYDLIRFGGLQHRRQDLVAGVAMGNPMREVGHSFPGAIDAGGHGMLGQRLSGSEALWWEFCTPNDLVCSTGDDVAGRDHTALFEIVQGNAPAPVNVAQNLLAVLLNPLAAIQQIPAHGAGLQTLLQYLVPGGVQSGHGAYPFEQAIPGDPRSMIDVAVDYLNGVAAAQ